MTIWVKMSLFVFWFCTAFKSKTIYSSIKLRILASTFSFLSPYYLDNTPFSALTNREMVTEIVIKLFRKPWVICVIKIQKNQRSCVKIDLARLLSSKIDSMHYDTPFYKRGIKRTCYLPAMQSYAIKKLICKSFSRSWVTT